MVQPKEERIHEIFESISSKYDLMNSVISGGLHKAWRKDTINRMQIQQGKKALDVCCGTADWTIALAEAVGAGGEAVGLDFSENMLSVGRDKVKDRGLENVTLVHGNAMKLSFPDNSFDYITIGFGLRNVKDRMETLKEMHRVVKPGGKVVCLETSQPTLFGFKHLYYFYFRRIMPLFGKIFAKSYKEYAWLHESAKDFPGRKELAVMFRQSGLTDIKVKAYSGGVAAVHLGEKPLSK